MHRFTRIGFAFLLAAALAATAAQAAGPLPGVESRRGATMATAATDVLARLRSFLAGLWSKNGCGADPSGRCLPATGSVMGGKNGCQVDPQGGCLPVTGPATAVGENGCEVDPSGRCNK